MSGLILILALLMPSAHAWDDHQSLTRLTLLGFKTQSPELWTRLNTPMTVTSLDAFLTRAFGPKCYFETARDTIFEGLGAHYEVLYTNRVDHDFVIDWEKGSNTQLLKARPQSDPANTQALGRRVTPLEVLSIYSDEPDWNMDDDVPQLLGKGVSQAKSGTATRMLRHFWYKGQDEWGIDFGKDQETDRRLQLYYTLSLIAFDAGDTYWGFRFLANALHYIQDITQPYHAKALISDKLTDKLSMVRAKLCEWSPGPSCTSDLTVDKQIIKNAWIMGAYHGVYEDFARGLFAPAQRFQTYHYISDFMGGFERAPEMDKLEWVTAATAPLIDARAVLTSAQTSILKFATEVGDESFEAFGFDYRYDMTKTKAVILMNGTDQSPGYRLATTYGYPYFNEATPRQERAVPKLVEQTHFVLQRAGVWSRQLVSRTLASLLDDAALAAVHKHKDSMRNRCSNIFVGP